MAWTSRHLDFSKVKSVSTFVARLSELAPRVVQRQVTYLAKLLESENYTLRCAIIEVCGNLIGMLSKAEEGERSENHKGQINAFFDVLEERFLDEGAVDTDANDTDLGAIGGDAGNHLLGDL